MATFINLTPHTINLNNGTSFPASGTVARVSSSFSQFDENGICTVNYGEITGLPEPQEGVYYIVSAMILDAVKNRKDVVAPSTGHPDVVRSDGFIKSVPGFVRK